MLLPLMFLVGMCLIDTANGILMAWVYGSGKDGNKQRLQVGCISILILQMWSSAPSVSSTERHCLSWKGVALSRYYNMVVTATSAAILGSATLWVA